MKLITLDCETTGVCAYDEMIQLSIIDGDNQTLFNELIKPTKRKRWDNASAINHIYPEDLIDKPCFTHYQKKIQAIIDDADIIVGYNVNFDLSFLKRAGITIVDKQIIDVMQEFAPIYGERKGRYYKWQKLTKCAEYYHYDWGKDNAHDSLADCKATLFCYKQINKSSD